MKTRALISVVLIGCATLLGCSPSGSTKAGIATISQSGDEIVVDLANRSSGYISLRVMDLTLSKQFWEVSLNNFDGGPLVLGEEPVGNHLSSAMGRNVALKQVFPEVGKPTFPKNQPLALFVDFRKDLLGVPGVHSITIDFELDNAGKLK